MLSYVAGCRSNEELILRLRANLPTFSMLSSQSVMRMLGVTVKPTEEIPYYLTNHLVPVEMPDSLRANDGNIGWHG